MKKLRPILMQPEMVRAELEYRKFQTRRMSGLKAVNQSPDDWELGTLMAVDKTGRLCVVSFKILSTTGKPEKL